MEIEQIVVNNMMVFSYLVWCAETKEALIIDPSGMAETLVEKITKKGLKLKYIVNTHGHADHSGGNTALKLLTGAQVVIHKDDNAMFTNPVSQMMAEQMGFAPFQEADITVNDGDILEIGKVRVQVLHTPGHTPGGICLLAEGNLFTGDTLFVGSVGRTDLPMASQEMFVRSFKEKILPLPNETIVWPGHDYGPAKSSTIGDEKKFNPFLRPPYLKI